MALLKCPDCGNPVSDLAPACPKCGRPTKTTVAPVPVEDSKDSEQKQVWERSGYVTAPSGSWGGWVVVGLFPLLALLVFVISKSSDTQYKIKTPQGQAESEECMKRAVDRIDFSGSGTTVVVPLSAVSELRTCMRDKGFTEKETQLMVDALLRM